MKKSLLAFLALASLASAELEAHEWGTFTTLSDSNGNVLRWYTPQSDHSALPKFVRRNSALFKYNMFTTVRMETPVIYFYPDKPMDVEVSAAFHNGAITELYPDAVPSATPTTFTNMADLGKLTRWKGKLLPPNDSKGLSMIPAVSSDERGAHYAAAREVPDAWIFHHRFDYKDQKTQKVITTDQADKFIFYRGAGDFPIDFRISNTTDSNIEVANHGTSEIQLGVLLEVRGDKARWSTLPAIQKAGEKPTITSTRITGEWKPIREIEAELTKWFQKTLTSEGLTSDEAAAMVATWEGSWFREAGLRAFTIMPREEVDKVLPLNVSPTPEKLVRVFVHRHELIRSEAEQELATLISDPHIATNDASKRLQKLELGRFSNAVLNRAADIVRSNAYESFRSLQQTTDTE